MSLPENLSIELFRVKAFPGDSDGKEFACNAEDMGSISGWEREGNCNPFLYSCLDRSLVCYGLCGHKESNMTEQLTHYSQRIFTSKLYPYNHFSVFFSTSLSYYSFSNHKKVIVIYLCHYSFQQYMLEMDFMEVPYRSLWLSHKDSKPAGYTLYIHIKWVHITYRVCYVYKMLGNIYNILCMFSHSVVSDTTEVSCHLLLQRILPSQG